MYLLESGRGGAGSKGETQIGARRGGEQKRDSARGESGRWEVFFWSGRGGE